MTASSGSSRRGRAGASATGAPASRGCGGRQMRALVVDDSTSSRAAITGALGRAGFQVFESGDSVEALDLLEERGDVDLALVDWDLPEADGLRFVLGLRSA